MGLFDNIFRAQKGIWTGGLSEIGDAIDITGQKRAQERFDQNQAAQQGLRQQSKAQQLAYLDQMQRPEVSPKVAARLAALEEQGRDRPLVADPFFQGQRAMVAQGGAQALAGVANQQLGRGVRGGFQNTGSIQDVYDRLGTQLAQVGQSAAVRRDQAQAQAAEMDQQLLDKRIEFDNAQMRARMAIEAGDAQAAQAAMQQAFQIQSQIDNMQRQFYGGLLQIAGPIAGAAIGGPVGAAAGGAAGNMASGAIGGQQMSIPPSSQFQLPQQSSPQAQFVNAPYSLTRR